MNKIIKNQYPAQPLILKQDQNEPFWKSTHILYTKTKEYKDILKELERREKLDEQYSELVKKYEDLTKELEDTYKIKPYTSDVRDKIYKLQDDIDELGQQLGEHTVRKFKRKLFRGIDWTGNPSKDSLFLVDSHIRETPEVVKYFQSYINSEGFNRILQNQKNWYSGKDSQTDKLQKSYSKSKKNPPKVFTLDMYPETSFYKPVSHTAFVGDRRQNDVNYINALGHEVSHGMSPYPIYFAAQDSILKRNTNTDPGHDSRPSEKLADIWGLKYLLYKEGIYDSRENKNITEEQVQKLREKYPNLRQFKQMDNKEIVFQLNHIAHIPIQNDYQVPIARKGKQLIKKSNIK